MPRKLHSRVLAAACLLAVPAAAAALRLALRTADPVAAPSAARAAYAVPRSFGELCALSGEELAKVDVARMNLLCAQGLAGAGTADADVDVDMDKCLATLDRWAQRVKDAETRYLPQFRRDPARYDGSLATFKCVMLALTLKEDFGVRYNMDLVRSGAMADVASLRFFRNSGDVFLHGLLADGKGTCSSLPVLMVAVGRRCGYPLHLVATKGHLFFRWDDGRERTNFEVAMRGIDSKPDEHYRRWPQPSTDAEVRAEGYLRNLTPAGELAVFADLRASCLREHGRHAEAAEAYRIALRSNPESPRLRQLAALTPPRTTL